MSFETEDTKDEDRNELEEAVQRNFITPGQLQEIMNLPREQRHNRALNIAAALETEDYNQHRLDAYVNDGLITELQKDQISLLNNPHARSYIVSEMGIIRSDILSGKKDIENRKRKFAEKFLKKAMKKGVIGQDEIEILLASNDIANIFRISIDNFIVSVKDNTENDLT